MANYTTNYNLYRPSRNDVDLEVDTSLDQNFVSIDGQMKKIDKKVAGVVHLSDFNPVGDGVTDDQTAIVNAVTEAFNKNMALNWGSGTYLTTGNIPNFHSVKHIGEGIVKRGSDLFYISPKSNNINKIYVSMTGGSNTFDGLSANQPVRQLYVAVAFLPNYGFALRGKWQFILSAEVHDRRVKFPPGLISENSIEIIGPDVGGHPNIPIASLSEGIGISAMGIEVSNNTRIKVSNLLLRGFNGSTSSSGLSSSKGAKIETSNVHFQECFYGVSGQNSEIIVPDGIFDGCGKTNLGTGVGAGIRSLMGNTHYIGIQNAGSRLKTPIFRNCRYGVWAQETSTGHVDWCTFEDNEDGFVGRVSSRGNLDGCSFKRNVRGVRLEGNSNAYLSSNVEWGTGVDANSYNVVRSSGSQLFTSSFIEGIEMGIGKSYSTIDNSEPKQTVTSTSNTIVKTYNLLAPLWRNQPSNLALGMALKVSIRGTLNGSNSNKRIYVRLGTALAGITFAAADSGTFKAEAEIDFTGPDTQYIFMEATRHLGTSVRHSKVNGTNPMTSNTTLTVEAQVDNSADSVVVDFIKLEWS